MSERLERMLAAVGAENAAEGSFVQDNVRAVAEVLDRIVSMKLNEMVNRFFPQLAMGDDLTLAAANFGVNRRGATPASVQVTLTGTPGTEIDGEIRVASGELIFACETGALGDDGKATILATCETPGAAGNVLPGTVTEFVTPYEGLDTVTNATAGFGGADEESDEDLLIRLEARLSALGTGGGRGSSGAGLQPQRRECGCGGSCRWEPGSGGGLAGQGCGADRGSAPRGSQRNRYQRHRGADQPGGYRAGGGRIRAGGGGSGDRGAL